MNIGWVKVNSEPLINKLKSIITEWIEAYTSFLLVNTVAEINNI